MKAKLLKYSGIVFSLFCLCLLISQPRTASEAVKRALGICSGIILPSLLPFFFISGIISELEIPEILSRVCGKIMSKIFRVSGYAATPLFLGLLGGYPIGAASLAGLVKSGKISSAEAERLLPFCNNTGPAFIVGAVGSGIFDSPKLGVLLYAVHILASVSIGLLSRKGSAVGEITTESRALCSGSLISALPGSVSSAVEKSLNICGFVIFFSILSSLLEELSILSSLALTIDRLPGLDIGFCKSLLAGILELGSGIAGMARLENRPVNYALASFILGFGSLSVHCQTLAVVNEAKIKCARHFAGRILHGLISALLTFVLSYLIRI